MGGRAFPGLSLVRVKREDVFPTVKYVVDTLNLPGFTLDYALDHLMGSAGKQESSGDLDFAVNSQRALFLGQEDLPVFKLRDFATRAREVLPAGHVNTKTLKGGQFQTAFPVAGDPSKGLVQVDFMEGNPEWLKFSHYSPGLDVSPHKGVMRSTMLGVLAKMRKDFELYDGETRVARVGLRFDLEKGLFRQYKLQLREGQGMSVLTPDEFETAVPSAPRFTRLGYVTSPEVVLELLFGQKMDPLDVDSFEKVVRAVRLMMPDRFQEAKERFLEAFTRSAGANDLSLEEVALDPVWSD